LFLHGAEEVAGLALSVANLVEIDRHGNRPLADDLDIAFVGQRARTEPLAVASAALQWIVAGYPQEHGPLLLARLPHAFLEIEDPRHFLPFDQGARLPHRIEPGGDRVRIDLELLAGP